MQLWTPSLIRTLTSTRITSPDSAFWHAASASRSTPLSRPTAPGSA